MKFFANLFWVWFYVHSTLLVFNQATEKGKTWLILHPLRNVNNYKRTNEQIVNEIFESCTVMCVLEVYEMFVHIDKLRHMIKSHLNP